MKTPKKEIHTGYVFERLDTAPREIQYLTEKISGNEYTFEWADKKRGGQISVPIHVTLRSCWNWVLAKFLQDREIYKKGLKDIRKSIQVVRKNLKGLKKKKK